MRIALVADIHGNSFALRNVLDELAHENVDRIVCLGDIAVLGPDPTGSIRLVREYADLTVLGNTDQWLVDRLDHPEVRGAGAIERELATWSMDAVEDADLTWLGGLPLTGTIALPGDRELLVFHGSPRSNEEIISALTADADLPAMIPREATFAAGGHTHIQLMKKAGATIILNPGSAGFSGAGPDMPGLPRNRDVTFAEFAVLGVDDAGVSISFRRIELPVQEMLAWGRGSDMPAYDWWAARWKPVTDKP